MNDTTLPAGPLLAYYGDDFTGSTDVMEAFTAAGVPTVLFLRTPGPEWVQRFAHMRCIGLAGTARGHTPAWMREHLPAAFASLQAFGAPLLHYKVCSTFDSSPERGSIGQAVDLGVPHMRGRWSPMVVGAPRLRRYQAFGHLFAAMGDVVHRLDRHPTMSRHPVTPMGESDLRVHLARQTPRRIELIDLVTLKAGQGERVVDAAGCYVTPGFIETHNHWDGGVWWNPNLEPLPAYGATTSINGNCGFSLAPAPDGEFAHRGGADDFQESRRIGAADFKFGQG